MFINHFFVENIDNQRIKYYKEGNQYGLHANWTSDDIPSPNN